MEFTFQIIRILIVSLFTFSLAFFIFPFFIEYLRKIKVGKQVIRPEAPIFEKLHKKKEGTPTMGGVIIIIAVICAIAVFSLLGIYFPESIFAKIQFLSRKETFLPLGLLIVAGGLGFVDDLVGTLGYSKRKAGLRIREKLILYFIPALIGSLWFYFKLNWDLLQIPFVGALLISYLYIPVFIFITMTTAFATNETDGLDGLAGGTLIIAFICLAIIAFSQGRYDLTALIAAIIGGLVAFLWHNIYPARIFLGDTGSMGLGILIGIIALLTNTALLLPLILFIPFIESISVLLQLFSKKVFKRKIFLSTPFHHHFEALGFHETTITMRFWIISIVLGGLGVIIYLIS